jgi:pyrroline-5-carboxylate reductase
MTVPFPSVCLIGAGRLGGALLRGWLAQGMPPENVSVQDPHLSPEMQTFLGERGIHATANAGADILLLAVKPQAFEDVLRHVAHLAAPATTVVSVAAGKTIASMEHAFAAGTGVIRTLPNLPAEVGRAVTAMAASASVSEAAKRQCEMLFQAVGHTVWLESEEQMDAVTGLSGSGPGYLFYIAECLTKAGIEAGLSADVSTALARVTIAGAGEMLYQLPLPAATLRENVTSPNGTTAAGLSVLMEEARLERLLSEAVAAAARRSRELSGA